MRSPSGPRPAISTIGARAQAPPVFCRVHLCSDEGPCCHSSPGAIWAYFLLQAHQGEGKWRYTMISAWWLVLAFLVGAYSGVLVMAIMSAARDVAKEPVRRAAVRAHLRRTTADAS